jgi:hypothetical protein
MGEFESPCRVEPRVVSFADKLRVAVRSRVTCEFEYIEEKRAYPQGQGCLMRPPRVAVRSRITRHVRSHHSQTALRSRVPE